MDKIAEDVAAIREIDAVPNILRVIADVTGMGFVAVARVTESRWIACEVLDAIDFGLKPGNEMPVEATACNEVRTNRREVVIDDLRTHPVYSCHPDVEKMGFRSYISVPIILANGEFFGTLCAIDPQPRRLEGTTVVGMFRLFAQLIGFHLDAHQRLNDSNDDLLRARAELDNSAIDLAASRADLATFETDLTNALEASNLREQFIAVLGHDLRNPLAAIEGGRRVLSGMHEDAKSVRVLRLMGESVQRMSGLIDNVMDFARGRLGGGIGLDIIRGQRIEPVLAQVINEIRSAYPDRHIESHFDLTRAIDVDPPRIAQMMSNLLGNALTHGDPGQPVIVEAGVENDIFVLAVANGGDPIPPETYSRLFQPFYRGTDVQPALKGLGLGLYIAAQIAQAHNGHISVVSDAQQTRFTFRMPLQ